MSKIYLERRSFDPSNLVFCSTTAKLPRKFLFSIWLSF